MPPTPFLCPKQATPVPLAPAGLTEGRAVSTSGYHLSHILLPQHPFPNGNETVWWNQKGKSIKFNIELITLRLKRPQVCPEPQPCADSLLPGFVGMRGQSSGPAGAKVKGGPACSLQSLCHQGDSLSPNYMLDSWEHSLWQGSRASCLHPPAACSLQGDGVFSLRNAIPLDDVPLSQTHTRAHVHTRICAHIHVHQVLENM